MVENKRLIPSGLAYLADNICSKNNILGAAKGSGARWAKGLNLPREGETIFFAGCGYQYASDLESLMSLIRKVDKSPIDTESVMSLAAVPKKLGVDAAGIYRKVMVRGHEDDAQPLKDAIKVLGKLGVKLGYLADEEPCCGGLLYYIGLHKEFSMHAEKVYNSLKTKGVKRIISLVPSCTSTLRNIISSNVGGCDLEVTHFCEVVSKNISSLKLRFPREVKVTYHDPCQLVRFLGLVEEPRQILRAIKGIELVEAGWTKREWATCCGGGGGFEAVFPGLSQILAVNRARELVETGAEIIVTQCPGCIMQLKTGLKELKANNVEVLDLAQVVAMAMEA
ncbi:MAG: (Fe-S)-binding protein [Dehalococcoidales bacterium]|nr:(Fe-S)-binding protein [Dehalococcoidales bacterium]